ncbi:MAG TPA: DUF424 family protein [Candidatus Pacearchaeota archaeon]|nr:DUF424 family protein [Candidatus Pacearchaeota archaeon]
MDNILIRVHESYRWVVAVCDTDVFGRKLVDSGVGSRQSAVEGQEGESRRVLDVSGDFFKGEEFNEIEARGEIVRCANEDATFNFVGKDSVELAKELGIVKDEGVMEIEGVPVALVLL